MTISYHKSVLTEEVLQYLSPKSNKVYVDGTVGGGGHSEKILKGSSPSGILIGIDIDCRMLEIAKERLKVYKDRCHLVQANYTKLQDVLKQYNIEKVDGIVFDLGVSTEHFKEADKGFSFNEDGPLDMRLDQDSEITAADIVNTWEAKDLIKILYQFSGERSAKRIVNKIVEERKTGRIETTKQLSRLIVRAVGREKIGKIHSATRTFQALRIAVNNEIENIKTVLPAAIDVLNPGGRLCVISFHSLEDRIVKNSFRLFARSCICPKEVMQCVCNNKPKVKIVTKKPVVPERDELRDNPRSRSAKLRVVEKI